MAFTEAQKRELDKFCLETGGGIFGDRDKKNPAPKPIVVIGLGGLGTRTLNELKHKVMLRIKNYDNYIKFLAIDSDDSDMNNIKASNPSGGGYMNDDEMTNLYSSQVNPIIEAGTYKNEDWITEGWTPTVNGTGCGQMRQNGRFLLSVDDVFNRINTQIESKINSARSNASPGDKINVIFIAGISGGTGSGTFIDIAYITHNIFREKGISNYKIAGYIYTPDVQFTNPNINEVGRAGLSKNGFAALKELDYYMNIEKINGVYKWPFRSIGQDIPKNIYDTCVIVTGRDHGGAVIGSEEKCRDALTETLVLALSDTTFMENGVPAQMIDSLMDNNIASFNTWSAVAGADDNIYPKTCNYVYNSVGYGSVKIPVDYIMTYIANEMYKYAMNEFRKEPDANYINGIMSQANIVDYSSIDSDFRSRCLNRIVIPKNKKPGIGDLANGTSRYQEYKNIIINSLIDQLNNDLDDDIKQFIDNANKIIVNRLESSFDTEGPIFVNRALSKTSGSDNTLSGIIERIMNTIKSCTDYHDKLVIKYKSENDLDAEIARYANGLNSGFLGIGGTKIDDVLPTVNFAIAEFVISRRLAEKMIDRLGCLRNDLTTYCNNIFDVYTKAMDHIGSLLEKDADTAIKGEYTDNSYTAYAIKTKKDANNPISEILYKYLDDVVLTDSYKQRFYNDFKQIITGDGKDVNEKKRLREKFTSEDMNTFGIVEIMRNEFNNLLANYSNDAIERFLVVYYGGLDPYNVEQTFNDIWGDTTKKNTAMNAAAAEIKNELEKKGMCLYQETGGAMTPIVGKYFVTCPANATSLEAALKAQYAGVSNVTVCTVEGAKSVDKIQNVYGLALAKIAGISDAMKVYDHFVERGDKDFHLNGSEKSDFTDLPSPVPVEMFGLLHIDSEHERAVVDEVNKNIDEAIKYGLITKPGKNNAPWDYSYINDAANIVVTDEMVNNICDAPNTNIKISDIKQIVDRYLESRGYKVVSGKVTMQYSGFNDISSEQTMRHIVRKNMDVYRRIRDSVKVYSALINPVVEMNAKIREASDNLIRFKENIKKFSDYINYGLIRLDEINQKDWIYDARDDETAGKLVSGYNNNQFCLDNIIFIAYMEFLRIPDKAAKVLEERVFDIQSGNYDEDPDIQLLMTIMPKLARIADKPLKDENGKINIKSISEFNITRRAINEEEVTRQCDKLNEITRYFDVNIEGVNSAYDLLVLFYKEFKNNRSLEE